MRKPRLIGPRLSCHTPTIANSSAPTNVATTNNSRNFELRTITKHHPARQAVPGRGPAADAALTRPTPYRSLRQNQTVPCALHSRLTSQTILDPPTPSALPVGSNGCTKLPSAPRRPPCAGLRAMCSPTAQPAPYSRRRWGAALFLPNASPVISGLSQHYLRAGPIKLSIGPWPSSRPPQRWRTMTRSPPRCARQNARSRW